MNTCLNATKLVRLREERGLHRSELARHSGVSNSYLKYIEREGRQPSVVIRFRIARALGVTVEDFCDPADEQVAS